MARILVVDDEHNIRLMVRLALQHVGHQVQTAVDGPDALDRFGVGEEWDLILLDQRMPGMSGIDVLTEMRRRRPDARVIIITAFGTVDLATQALALGAKDLLRKPFTADTLRGAVSAVLEDSDAGAPPPHAPVTVNGFRIVDRRPVARDDRQTVRQSFGLRTPQGHVESCTVELPSEVVGLVEAHIGGRTEQSNAGLWSGLCEEVLANYVWQNADAPAGGFVRADELTSGMRRWVDSLLAAEDAGEGAQYGG